MKKNYLDKYDDDYKLDKKMEYDMGRIIVGGFLIVLAGYFLYSYVLMFLWLSLTKSIKINFIP